MTLSLDTGVNFMHLSGPPVHVNTPGVFDQSVVGNFQAGSAKSFRAGLTRTSVRGLVGLAGGDVVILNNSIFITKNPEILS